jgi:hypothetical protein
MAKVDEAGDDITFEAHPRREKHLAKGRSEQEVVVEFKGQSVSLEVTFRSDQVVQQAIPLGGWHQGERYGQEQSGHDEQAQEDGPRAARPGPAHPVQRDAQVAELAPQQETPADQKQPEQPAVQQP